MIDVEQAALAMALDPEFHDVVVGPEVLDLRKHLHAKQLEVFECDAIAMNLLGGRQGGKTFVDVGWLIEGGLELAGSTNPYFALSGRSLADIMWPEVVAWWVLLGLPSSGLHPHTRTAVLPNGSSIKGFGTDDRRTIETVGRGSKYYRIVIDEMGVQPKSFIEYFVGMLWPTMLKNRGRMLRSGNPGLTLDGYWYDQTNNNRRVDTPLFHWTAYDNPALGTFDEIEAFVDKYLLDSGLDRDSVTYKREWLAKWVEDAGALVFPLAADNFIDELPTFAPLGQRLDPNLWRRALAADVGIVDACAFAITASHPHLQDDYVVHVEKHVGMITEQFRNRLRELIAEFRPTGAARIDVGGMGKAYAVDCQRHGLPVMPAEKTEKRANVRLFRDRAIAKRLKVIAADCLPLIDECAVLGWDAKRELPREGLPDDAVHATLYSWRDLHNYRSKDAPKPLTAEQRARLDEEEWVAKRLKAAAVSRRRARPSEQTKVAFLRH